MGRLAREVIRRTPMAAPRLSRRPAARVEYQTARWRRRASRRVAKAIAQVVVEQQIAKLLALVACRLALQGRAEGAVH